MPEKLRFSLGREAGVEEWRSAVMENRAQLVRELLPDLAVDDGVNE